MAKPKLVLASGVGLMGLLALAALWIGRADAPQSAAGSAEASAGAIYAATFPDVAGAPQALGRWQRNLLIINFWATWCGPCKEEMPLLASLQKKYADKGLQIVGIAVDSRANVVKFEQENNVGYPLLPEEAHAMEFSKRLGNRAALLPYSVVVRPGGEIAYVQHGAIRMGEFDAIIQKNLPNAFR